MGFAFEDSQVKKESIALPIQTNIGIFLYCIGF